MILTETSPAATEPVSMADFAAHLRVTQGFVGDPTEDGLMALYLRSATAAIEARLAKALIARGFNLTTAAWNRDGHLILPVGPVAAIDAVSFTRDGQSIAVAEAAWVLMPGEDRQRLTGAGGGPLPTIPAGHVAELAFTAGYAPAPEDVPGDLSQAVLMLAAQYFENRYADMAGGRGLPGPVEALISTRLPVRL